MILLVKLILITTIWVLGLTIITTEGMGLYAVRLWAKKKIEEGNRWVEPLIYCHWCMPSIHAILGYTFAYGLGILHGYSVAYVLMYPLVVAGASLLCGLIWEVRQMLVNLTAYYDNMEQLSFFDIKDRKDAFNRKNPRQFNPDSQRNKFKGNGYT